MVPFSKNKESCVHFYTCSTGNFNASIKYATKDSDYFSYTSNIVTAKKDCSVYAALTGTSNAICYQNNTEILTCSDPNKMASKRLAVKKDDIFKCYHSEPNGTAYRHVNCFLIFYD